MTTLTKQQIERQDFVDNKIFELLQELHPQSETIKWDIETIGTVRDEIWKQIVDTQKNISEKKFYPYLQI